MGRENTPALRFQILIDAIPANEDPLRFPVVRINGIRVGQVLGRLSRGKDG